MRQTIRPLITMTLLCLVFLCSLLLLAGCGGSSSPGTTDPGQQQQQQQQDPGYNYTLIIPMQQTIQGLLVP